MTKFSDEARPNNHRGRGFLDSIFAMLFFSLVFVSLLHSWTGFRSQQSTSMFSHGAGSVYFLSHGAAFKIFDTESAAYKAWKVFGTILTNERPKGIVVVSAHWASTSGTDVLGRGSLPDLIDQRIVNTDESNPMIYDFYGFPAKYYREIFISHGSRTMVQDVQHALTAAGIVTRAVKRGLDHGVWG